MVGPGKVYTPSGPKPLEDYGGPHKGLSLSTSDKTVSRVKSSYGMLDSDLVDTAKTGKSWSRRDPPLGSTSIAPDSSGDDTYKSSAKWSD